MEPSGTTKKPDASASATACRFIDVVQAEHIRLSFGRTGSIGACRCAQKIKRSPGKRPSSSKRSCRPAPTGPHLRATTIKQAVKRYIDYLMTASRRPKTITKYGGLLNDFAEYAEGHGFPNLSQLTAEHFDAYRASRKPTHLDKSMYNDGVIIKQFIKWCKTRRLLHENPLEHCRLRKPLLVPKDRPSLRKWTRS